MELLEYPATDSQSSIVDPCILIPPGATVVDNVKTFFSNMNCLHALWKKKNSCSCDPCCVWAHVGQAI